MSWLSGGRKSYDYHNQRRRFEECPGAQAGLLDKLRVDFYSGPSQAAFKEPLRNKMEEHRATVRQEIMADGHTTFSQYRWLILSLG